MIEAWKEAEFTGFATRPTASFMLVAPRILEFGGTATVGFFVWAPITLVIYKLVGTSMGKLALRLKRLIFADQRSFLRLSSIT